VSIKSLETLLLIRWSRNFLVLCNGIIYSRTDHFHLQATPCISCIDFIPL